MSRNASIIDKLNLILESIGQIEEYTKRINKPDDFLLSPEGMLRLDACVMRFQVIGESVRSLLTIDNTPLLGHNEIPWRKIVGLRNLISHEYMSVDEVLIYNIIRDDLPLLKKTVEEIISE